ncbi:NUDIX domain-containing protein [Actinomadura sp. 9N215]|uniref:NUDIX domain-containing protein n=1 Tax=Actinomadura sp. 9N215 TaxID=3375150 RepID=UPI0037B3589A
MAWYASLPTCHLATGMLLTDPHGRVLLVKTRYCDDWGRPGGVADEGEPRAWRVARRSTRNWAWTVPVGSLLGVDFVAASGARLRSMIHLVFDGGAITGAPAITVQEDEIGEYAFLPLDTATARMAPATAHRLPRALAARRPRRVA